MERIDHMKLLPGMEDIGTEIMDRVLSEREAFDYFEYTEEDVMRVLEKESIDSEDFKALLSPAALLFLEQIAEKARNVTRRYFGNSIYLFTPLYISNYCENLCIYCGFNRENRIRRAKLDAEVIEKELVEIAKSGLQDLLILTGESRKMSDVDYIGQAVRMARNYFKTVGVEVYPMNSDEYARLRAYGADYVTVFQETYNTTKYEELHLAGNKRVFPYRFNAQERALMGGMRGVAFGALLGLDDFRKDAFATGLHASLLQKKYPHAEISLSCPRLRPIINHAEINPKDVHERQLVQIICAYRLFLPYAGITVSSRESANFRNHIIQIAATKISSGVSTGIGEHSADASDPQGDEQFEIADTRTTEEVFRAIVAAGLQPVMSDYVDTEN